MSIKRYAMIHNLATPEHLVSSMQEWSIGPLAGDWVRFEDYSNLVKENDILRKAVASSPVASLNLAKLEGKTTYEEINGKPLV